MDDIVTSTSSKKEGDERMQEMENILSKNGFKIKQ